MEIKSISKIWTEYGLDFMESPNIQMLLKMTQKYVEYLSQRWTTPPHRTSSLEGMKF